MTRGASPGTATDTMARRGEVTFAARAMGSPLRLTIVTTGSSAMARRRSTVAWDAVRAEFEAAEEAMSRFRTSSEITILNRAIGAGPVAVSRRLSRALVACDRANRVTEGRFDPRVLADLERLGDSGAPLGTAADTSLAGRGAMPKRIVERSRAGVTLPVAVDLGGIGKGLALRWAAAVLESHDVRSFLLDAGGDLVSRGRGPGDVPWQIGIEDPTGGSVPLAVVSAPDRAVTTSSIRLRAWQVGDRSVHHLIDPRTGEPGGSGLLAVTVAGSDPAWAEVWSKALFLEGSGGIAAQARKRGLAAWWVSVDGSLEMTPAARPMTMWTLSA